MRGGGKIAATWRTAACAMVLVNREAPILEQSSAVLGVYFLLARAEDPRPYRAYVDEVGRRTPRHHWRATIPW